MGNISSYLTFNGNCREAMEFYNKCFGGELTFHTIGESPMGAEMPGKMKNYILQSTLSSDGIILFASDMVFEKGLVKGNNVSLMLNCKSEKDLKKYYKNLAKGGEVDHPVQKNFWGILFGDLTDKFGNHWMLNYSK